MPPQYPARRERSKKKGQFVKKKVAIARENLLKSIERKRALKAQARQPLQSAANAMEIVQNSRRIVELDTLGSELWCSDCQIPLSLRNIVAEKREGLASVFSVRCSKCSFMYFVHSNKYNRNTKTYEVNDRLAFGMIDSGSGESHINTTLLSINVPPLAPATIKRYERRVGCIIEEVAKESCVDAIPLEKKLTLLNEPEQVKNHLENDLEEKIVHVKASYDSGWQKHGNGRSYNSLSGHGTAIGYYSGKVISVAVRSKDCRFCRIGHPKCDHDCRRNYEDSAKSMEADMAVELFNNNPLFKEEHIQIRTLIGDEDSCTIAAVRRAVNYDVEKWSDYNHIKKSFTSSLYTLKLSPTLINYFSKTFSIAIKKNRGDATEIENTLLAIVPHAYGEHSNCGDWCTAKENEHYIYRYLPHGKSLTDSNVKVKVGELVARYAANSAKIAPCGSTEANESLNQTIATKNPKARHYSGSESLSFRVHAAVCQKNIGCRYSNTVFSKMGYFESETSLRIKKQKDALRERRSNTIRTVANKRRRQELKKTRASKNSASSRKEGVSYENGVAIVDVSNLIPRPDNYIHEKINLSICKVLIYDLETTGTSHQDEIAQIAVESFTCINSYNCYIIPSKKFSIGATQATGLHISGGELHLYENRVFAIPAKIACEQFLQYLRNFKCSIILLAHNGFSFDNPRLIRLMQQYKLYTQFCDIVKGFADSLQIFRCILSERKKQKKSFAISELLKDYLLGESSESLHNAVNDVVVLKKLLQTNLVTEADIQKNSKSFSQIEEEKYSKKMTAVSKATWTEYKDKLSLRLISKLARAHITYDIMQKAFEKGGEEGLRILCTENVNKKCRVTQNEKMLSSIYKIFLNA